MGESRRRKLAGDIPQTEPKLRTGEPPKTIAYAGAPARRLSLLLAMALALSESQREGKRNF